MNNNPKSQNAFSEEDQLVISRAREHLIDFEIATDERYDPNWHHERISEELEHIEKYGDRDYKILILTVPPRHGKQLAHDTPVLTTRGWKTHGDLKVGDRVYGRDGTPKAVKWLSEETESDYIVSFSDGSHFYTHGNHEWLLQDKQKHNKERVIETKELFETPLSLEGEKGKRGHRYRFYVDENKTVYFNRKKLAIDPYMLGVWLGDGRSSSGDFCGAKEDYAIVKKLEERGYKTSSRWEHKDTKVQYYYYSSLRKKLKSLHLLQNKHIPVKYKMSNLEDRLELLAGLIDTDGHRDKKGRYRFSTCSPALVRDVKELVISLGGNAYVMEYAPVLSTSGIQGRQIVYQVGFNLPHSLPVALERKSNKSLRNMRRRRSLISVEKAVYPKKGRCIEVEDSIYLVGKSLIPTHNSRECSIDFPAWYLGRNPEKEIIIASYSAELAQGFGGKTRDKVDSVQYKAIFPQVRLKEDEKAKGRWSTNKGGGYMAAGVGGAITGRGADVFLIDDPVKNSEEANSLVYREKVWDWFVSTAFTRLHPHGVMIIIMTRWNLDDLAGRVIADPDLGRMTKVIKLPAIATKDGRTRKQGEALWPSRYPLSALEDIKTVVGPYVWASLYQCNPIATDRQEFKPEWYKYIEEQELDSMQTARYLTVDTAMSKKAQADFCGFCDNSVDRENFWNLKAWRAKLGPEELVDTLFALHETRKYSAIGIEKTTYTDGLKPFLDAEQRKRNRFLPIVELSHKGTAKEIRIRSVIPRYASGSIRHIEGQCDALEEEQAQFPNGMHDDVIDSLGYMDQIVSKKKKSVSIFRKGKSSEDEV